MPSGGKRAGSGRPKKADAYARPIADAEQQIVDRLPSLIDNMFRLADGVTVQETDKDGHEFVYTRPPDRQANEYLINRILGKPVERQELTGKDGNPIEVTARTLPASAALVEAWRNQLSTLSDPDPSSTALPSSPAIIG